MKRAGTVMLNLGFLCATGTAYAQSNNNAVSPSPQPVATANIVVVDFNAAVLRTTEAQKAMEALRTKYTPREQELQKLNDEVEATKRSLNDAGSRLTDAERAQKLQSLDASEKRLQRNAEDFKNDSEAESQQTFQQVAQKLFLFLQGFSKQHSYTAVLDRGPEASPFVWYAASNVDVTDQVVKSYDARYAAGATSLPDKPSPQHVQPGTPPR